MQGLNVLTIWEKLGNRWQYSHKDYLCMCAHLD